MVVNDGQHIRLLQAGHRLGRFVVVHQHHPLAPGLDEVVAGQGPHHPLLLVQNGVAAVAALEHHLPHVVNIVLQVEGDDLLLLGQTAHGDGLEDPAHGPEAVIGGGDDAGVLHQLPDALGQLRLTQHHAGHAEGHRLPQHVRLVAADEDRLPLAEGGQLPGLGQGQNHLTGDGVHHLLRLPQQLALQNAEDVEQGHGPEVRRLDGLHIKAGDVPGGEHPPEMPLVVGDRNGGDVLVVLHG